MFKDFTFELDSCSIKFRKTTLLQFYIKTCLAYPCFLKHMETLQWHIGEQMQRLIKMQLFQDWSGSILVADVSWLIFPRTGPYYTSSKQKQPRHVKWVSCGDSFLSHQTLSHMQSQFNSPSSDDFWKYCVNGEIAQYEEFIILPQCFQVLQMIVIIILTYPFS